MVAFNEAFSNHSLSTLQSFRTPDVGPAQLGFGTDADSIYRAISVNFTVDPAATLIPMTAIPYGLDGSNDDIDAHTFGQ